MEQRGLVFDTLAEQQTVGRDESPIEQRRREYFPFKPYCEVCGRDDTRVTAYEADTVHYTCRRELVVARRIRHGPDQHATRPPLLFEAPPSGGLSPRPASRPREPRAMGFLPPADRDLCP